MKILNRYRLFIMSLAIALGWSNAASAQILISEIMYDPCSNASSNMQGSDQNCEFIEIFNSYSTPFDLCGMTFTSGVGFTFPCPTIIPSGGYLVIARTNSMCNAAPSGPEDYDLAGIPYTFTGGLGNAGETVTLSSCGGGSVVASATYPDIVNNITCESVNFDGAGNPTAALPTLGTGTLSVGTTPAPNCEITNVVAATATCNGDDVEIVITWTDVNSSGTIEVDVNNNGFVTMTSGGTYTIAGPTSAATNVTVTVRDACVTSCLATTVVDIPICPVINCDLAAVVNGDIIITEIMYDPCGTPDNGEFVEICNKSTTTTYDITNWTITDMAPGSLLGTFPTGTMLAPCECVFMTANNLLRNNASEGAVIQDCEGTVVDMVAFGGADFQAGCWDDNAGLSLSLVDWKNQTTATNDLVNNYAPGPNSFMQPTLGGTPGEPNAYFACLDVSGTITATCNADFSVTFDVPYTLANSATATTPLMLEAYNGAALLAMSSVTTAAGNATFTIPGPPSALSGVTITILPQGGSIDQACYDTEFILDLDITAPVVTGTLTPTTVAGCTTADAAAPFATVAELEAGGVMIMDFHPDADLTVSVVASPVGTCPIVLTRTYTVTDPCGNPSATFDHVITIEDTTVPVVTGTLTATTVAGCATSDAAAPFTTVAELESGGVMISDNCTADGDLIVSVVASTVGTCPIILTRTYTVTDACSNASATFDHVITIEDTTVPVVTGTLTATTVAGCATSDAAAPFTTVAELESGGVMISDNCTADADLTVGVVASTAGTCPIILTRTYTVTDACSNASATFDHVITIEDTTVPVVTGTLTATTVAGCATSDAAAPFTTVAELESGGVMISDNCTADADLTVGVVASTAGTCPIILTRTYTVTDACSNASATFDHVITIEDTTVPVVTGTLTATTVAGCATSDAAAPFTTVAELESGGVMISDNCTADADLTVGVVASTAGTCPIILTRTYTVTDACSNASATFDHVITIEDTTVPVVTGTLTATTVAGCATSDAAAPFTTVAELESGGVMISDNCTADADLTVGVVASTAGTCPIILTRTYTVTDACSNASATFDHVITIEDTTVPVVTGTLTATTVAGCATSDAAAPFTTVAELESGGVMISDNCTADADLTVGVVASTAGTCPIILTRTYTVTDACSNASLTFDHVITIEDTTVPVVTGTLTATTVTGCATSDAAIPFTTVAELESGGVMMSDNCTADVDLTVSVVAVTAGTCPIILTRTYTVTDACENVSASFDHVITIEDTTVPVVTGTLTATTVAGCATSDAAAPFATVAELESGGVMISDNCTADVDLTVSVVASTAGTCPIVLTRTYTVTDACENVSASFDHVITIEDTTVPVVTGTLTATTVAGCATSDAAAPFATVAELESGGVMISDNCTADVDLTVSVVASTAGTCPIVLTRTYTVTDACENVSASFDHVITIEDTTVPVVTGTLTATTVAGCGTSDAAAPFATVAELESGGVMISDNCTADGDLTVSVVASTAGTCPMIMTRTYTVTDACDNVSASFDHVITIEDTTVPIVTGTLTATTVAGCGTSDAAAPFTTVAELESGGVMISDNCTADVDLTVSVVASTAGTCPIVLTRTYTVTDACENVSASFDHVITIEDTTVPVVTGTLTATTVAGCATSDAAAPFATVAELESGGVMISDNCTADVDLTVSVVASTAGTCPMIMTRTYTVTDACDNVSASFDHVITIEDTTVPIVTGTLTATTVAGCGTSDAAAPFTTVAELESGGVMISDNCTADVDLTVSVVASTAGTCPIVLTRTYTVTDACENVSASFDHVITIEDTTVPVVTGTLTATTVAGCATSDAAAPFATVAELESGGVMISDNCTADVDLTVSVVASTAGTCPMIMTRTYTVTDACDNVSASFDHVITIEDTTVPIVTGTLTATTVAGCGTSDAAAPFTTVAELESGGVMISDNCNADADLTLSVVANTVGTCPIVMTRTYTVTDACENVSASFDHVITIEDTTVPVVTGTLTATTVAGCATSDAAAPFATVAELESGGVMISDNCTADADLTVSVVASTAGTCPIIMTRTYTVTDACSNASTTFDHVITIEDTTVPVVSGTLTATTVAGCATSDAAAPFATVAELESGGVMISDNCTADADLTVSVVASTVGTCPIVMTRTYTVTDACSNASTTFDHVITIEDTTVPVVSGTLTATTVAGCATSDAAAPFTTVAELESGGVMISDNCTADGDLTVSVVASTAGTCPMIMTRTYTVTDACDNVSASFDHVITIEDTTVPIVTGTLTATTVAGCGTSDAAIPFTTVAELESGGVMISDNCNADADLTLSVVANTVGTCPIVMTRTYTVTDACENVSASFDHVITIEDTTVPVVTGTLTATTVAGCATSDAAAPFATVAELESGGVMISDNCTADGDLIVSVVASTAGTCPIVLTRTYTVTDACSNASATFDHVITIEDTTVPVVTGTLTATTVAGCAISDAAAPFATVAELESGGVMISDNCTADADLTVSLVASTAGTCPIILTRTYTVTDACSNASATFDHVITIEDTTVPLVTGILTATTVAGCATSDAAVPFATVAELESGGVMISDNCTEDADLTVSVVASTAGTCPIILTRKYTVTDACSNASLTFDHVITIEDTTVPVVTGTLTATTVAGCATSDAAAPFATVAELESGGVMISDNCTADVDLTVSVVASTAGTCPMIMTRTYTVTDACDNVSASFDHVITIEDTTVPIVTGTLTATTVAGCGTSDAAAPFTTVAELESGGVMISDNCNADADLTLSVVANTVGTCPIVMTRTYTVTDACENVSASFDHVITIEDTTVPVVTGTLTATTVAGCATSDAAAPFATVAELESGGVMISDNCTADGDLTVSVVAVTTGACPIIMTRTYTVTDACSNASLTFDHVITIEDTEVPVVTGTLTATTVAGCATSDAAAPFATVAELESGGVMISDNCTADVDLTVSVVASTAGTCPIVLTRTYTVTDACENVSASFDHVITIEDTTVPVVTGTLTATTVAGCATSDAAAPFTTVAELESGGVMISDNCTADGDLTVGVVASTAGTCPIILTRTYTVTDACSNASATFDHVITIEDTTVPVVSGTLTATTVAGCATSDAAAPFATVAELESGGVMISDNCTEDADLTVSVVASTAGTCPIILTRTYTVTDACSNASLTFDHVITIEDTTVPVVTGTLTATTVAGCATSDAAAPFATVAELESGGVMISDNCTADADLTVGVVASTAGTCPIVLTRTYTVTDACENVSASFDHVITIEDTTVPVVTGTLTATTVAGCATSDAAAPFTTVAELEAGGVMISDNCTADGDLTVSVVEILVGTCPIVMTRTYTVTDACGNPSATFDHVITIEDIVGPVITCPLDIVVNLAPGACEAIVLFEEALAEDACGGETVVTQIDGLPSGSVFNKDASPFTITYEAADECGNLSDACSFTIEVFEFADPISSIACNDLIQISLDASCEIILGADFLLEGGPYGCYNDFTVMLLESNESDAAVLDSGPLPVLGASYVGDTTTFKVIDENGNSCRGTILVEDKLGPSIECPCADHLSADCEFLCTDLTAYYAGTLVMPMATASDNCGDDEPVITFTDVVASGDDCGTTTVTRTFVATDASGNTATCTTDYTFEPVSIEDVTFPPNFDTDATAFSCAEGSYDPDNTDGIIDLGTGVPMINSGVLYDGGPVASCGITSTYTDQVINICGEGAHGTYKILRTWTVAEWCQGAAPVQYLQIIKFVDDVDPVITASNPTNTTVSTSTNDCTASVVLPTLSATDACGNSILTLTVGAPTYAGYDDGDETTTNDVCATAVLASNGGSVSGLCPGTHSFLYTVDDGCGNTATYTSTVTVVDEQGPVVICDEYTVISITSDPVVYLTASSLDDGSFDACGDITFTALRMETTHCNGDEVTEAAESVPFYCCDAGTTTQVRVFVTDAAGLVGECMVDVEVQDNIDPVISCPGPVNLTCTDDYTDLTLTGGDAIGADNCADVTITHEDEVDIDDCGNGTIVRTFTATDGSTSVDCEQTITIANNDAFFGQFIQWPQDDLDLTGCPNANEPDFGLGPDVTGEPTLPGGANCSNIAVGYDDQVLTIVDGACIKIIRSWEVINWCEFDANDPDVLPGTQGGEDGVIDGYWYHNQTLKVVTNDDPVAVSPFCGGELDEVCTATDNCTDASVELCMSGTDDCTAGGGLTFEYEIASIITDDAGNETIGAFGAAVSATPGVDGTVCVNTTLAIGYYMVKWTVYDGCNNASEPCGYRVRVKDCTLPTPVAYNGLAANLDSEGSYTMWATELNSNSYDNCDPDITNNEDGNNICDYLIVVNPTTTGDVNIPPSADNDAYTFTCDDLAASANGFINVEFWTMDCSGNWNFVTTYIVLEDNGNACGTSTAMIYGDITTELGDMVETVTVNNDNMTTGNLPPGVPPFLITNNNGNYEFTPLNTGNDYEIEPEKDMNYTNGVSTIDIVFMSQHILGLNVMTSPYKLIAGDINDDGKVSTFDIVALRKLILGIDQTFPANDSWRFVDVDYVFPSTVDYPNGDPFVTPYPQTIYLPNLQTDEEASFIGVKIGDLNGNANPNALVGATNRNFEGEFTFTVADQKLVAGEEVTVSFDAKDFAELLGYQFTLNFDQNALEVMEVAGAAQTDISAANFGLAFQNNGAITTSWDNADANGLNANEAVFNVTFKLTQEVTLSSALSIGSRYTTAEAYTKDAQLLDVNLEFTNNDNIAVAFDLYQNSPNPFKNETVVGFTLPSATTATFTIYDASGKVLRLIEGDFSKGYNEISLNRSDLAGLGVLYYSLETPTDSKTKQMIIIE